MANLKVPSLSNARVMGGTPAVSRGAGPNEVRSPALDPAARNDFSAMARARAAESRRILEEFSLPPERVRSALSDPTLPTALAEVAEQLAPGGRANDAQSQYTASVIATHLAARRQLSTKLNALIRA